MARGDRPLWLQRAARRAADSVAARESAAPDESDTHARTREVASSSAPASDAGLPVLYEFDDPDGRPKRGRLADPARKGQSNVPPPGWDAGGFLPRQW